MGFDSLSLNPFNSKREVLALLRRQRHFGSMIGTFTQDQLALLLALASTACFSTASVFFTRFSRSVSPAWMNTFKAVVCTLCLLIVVPVFGLWTTPTNASATAFFLSGVIGLGIADLFLLSAFARIGAARTLMVFGFQPVIVGTASAFLFQQTIEPIRFVAIFFFILCLFILSFERYKREGHWEFLGLALALTGVLLDNTAVLVTRWGFDQTVDMNPFAACLLRTTGALALFSLYSLFRPIRILGHFRALDTTSKTAAVLASFFGTFMSLCLYLYALRKGHLASIAAIGLAGPVLSASLESLIEGKRPSPYLLMGIACMITGMMLFFGA